MGDGPRRTPQLAGPTFPNQKPGVASGVKSSVRPFPFRTAWLGPDCPSRSSYKRQNKREHWNLISPSPGTSIPQQHSYFSTGGCRIGVQRWVRIPSGALMSALSFCSAYLTNEEFMYNHGRCSHFSRN